MRLLKPIRLIWTFYKSFFLISLVITASCLRILWTNGLSVLPGVFWLKIATLGLTYYFINSYKNKEYYYYHNLGVSKPVLWITSFSFDLALFVFLVIQTYSFK